ncbi:MAG: serpin family protein [Synergistaceae bacterium]|nr:serpin family protein [Synergistaceae bacterium]
MKKIIALLLLSVSVFSAAAFAADTKEFSDKFGAKELAEIARAVMQKAKSSSNSDSSNGGITFGGNGVDINKIISAVNVLAQNNGNIESIFGEGAASPTLSASAVSAVNNLTMKLYGELANGDGNLFFSPYSISTALAMVYAGARGETAKEMETALGFSPAVHSAMASLIGSLNSVSPEIAQLHTANAIWPAADKTILSDYRNRVATDYFSEITTLDYSKPENARNIMNKWVEEKTNGKIKDIVSKGAVSAKTPLALTNAVYFKSDWQSKFETAATKQDDFHTAGGRTVKTNFMNQTGFFDYCKADGFEMLELPYKAERLSMYIILPENGKFGSVEKNLTAQQLDALVSQAARTNMRVSLPKFKLEENYNLNETLKKFGITSAFTDKANFSGMNGLLDISIGVVLHKTFLDVYEAGTEAAAATYVGMKSMAVRDEPKQFKADRPFIFVIRDNATGANIFAGRCMKP